MCCGVNKRKEENLVFYLVEQHPVIFDMAGGFADTAHEAERSPKVSRRDGVPSRLNLTMAAHADFPMN